MGFGHHIQSCINHNIIKSGSGNSIVPTKVGLKFKADFTSCHDCLRNLKSRVMDLVINELVETKITLWRAGLCPCDASGGFATCRKLSHVMMKGPEINRVTTDIEDNSVAIPCIRSRTRA